MFGAASIIAFVECLFGTSAISIFTSGARGMVFPVRGAEWRRCEVWVPIYSKGIPIRVLFP